MIKSGAVTMTYEFEAFCRDASAALSADPGVGGKEKIRVLLEELLKNKAFVNKVCGPDAELGTHQIYRDPEHDFVVLAHVNGPARKSPPHDHGSSWAIYGQADKYTEMSEYSRTDGGSGAGEAELKHERTYRLEPGMAGLYDVGAIHQIDYPEGARFVRVTGTDLAAVERLKFDTEAGKAQVIESVGVN
jgi:predicted metal-dependent enzyme (double-stranded beta helix superfamily)